MSIGAGKVWSNGCVKFKKLRGLAVGQNNIADPFLLVWVERVTQNHHSKRGALTGRLDLSYVARLTNIEACSFQNQPPGLHCGTIQANAQHVCHCLCHCAMLYEPRFGREQIKAMQKAGDERDVSSCEFPIQEQARHGSHGCSGLARRCGESVPGYRESARQSGPAGCHALSSRIVSYWFLLSNRGRGCPIFPCRSEGG